MAQAHDTTGFNESTTGNFRIRESAANDVADDLPGVHGTGGEPEDQRRPERAFRGQVRLSKRLS
jgi:hypothetical protein